jgi:hypothetical protein
VVASPAHITIIGAGDGVTGPYKSILELI